MMAVVRIDDGVTESFAELLELPEEEAVTKLTPLADAFALPGASDTTFVELAAGRYGLACFIPEGTTAEGPGDGPPHFVLGMMEEFTVG